MLRCLFETGHPWITYKDNANLRYSNAHEGVIHSSNLCTEIFLHTKPSRYEEGEKTEVGETAVCNLSSVNLKTHLKENGKLDFKLLEKTIATQMRMLDNVIDINFYPTKEAQNSNLKHRPVGAGSMGWADVFHSYKVDFSSPDAVKFSDELYEFISYQCIKNSSLLAKERGAYSTYSGSLWSNNILPIDTYKTLMEYLDEKPILHRGKKFCPELDWKKVRTLIKENGMRNSNTMAIAPTATISYIQGCSPCIEPDFSVLFVYENKSGNSTIINEWFVKECKELGIWDQSMIDAIKASDGDVTSLDLPQEVKDRFKTCYDQDQMKLIESAAARQKWIDMGQSLNLFYGEDSLNDLHKIYTYGRSCGLKSTYYLRTKAASTIEKSYQAQRVEDKHKALEGNSCSILDPTCESCQ